MGWKDPGQAENIVKMNFHLLRREVGHEMARSEAPVEGHELAERAPTKRLKVRKVSHGGVTYAAVSAHELLEHEDYSHRARPGHPLG